MRILFLTAGFPYPPVSGGVIKTLSILNYLRLKHDLSVISFSRTPFSRAPLTPEQTRWAEEFGNLQSVPVSHARNAISPSNLALSYLHRIPLGIERTRSREFRAAVATTLSGSDFDALFADHWLVAQYLPHHSAGLKLLHEHNAEYVIWRHYARLESNPLRRLLLQLEARRVRKYEAEILPRFDTVFAVSEPDRQALITIGADPQRTRILPNLPDPALLDLPPLSFSDGQANVLYFGTLSWQPNLEGLHYFLNAVWPGVRQRLPDPRFVIAGKGAPSWLQRLASATPGVHYRGPVDDPESLYNHASVSIETTRSGGGTKLKILNSLARGLPVVATPEAIEGIEATLGQHLLVGSDPATLADAIESLLTDPGLCQRLSEAGRTLIRERYVAAVAFTALDEALRPAAVKATEA